MVFPVVIYGCESWIIKKAECRKMDVFELWSWRRLLRVPWTARRSNQSILKEINQSWVFIGRTDAEPETPVLWPPDVKSWLIGKDPDAGKDWGQEEKGTSEDEMVGWHHWWNGHEFEQAPGVGGGQGDLACCSPWGCRVGHDWATELECRIAARKAICYHILHLNQRQMWVYDSDSTSRHVTNEIEVFTILKKYY